MNKILGYIRPFILQPLTLNNWKRGFVRKNFFLSFEDSLNYLFQQKQLPNQQEYCLVPNFYCPSTLKFISRYFKLIFYQINNDFSVNKRSYWDQITKYQPRAIINYCFTGFNLSQAELDKLFALCPATVLVIEDYAHRIINPRKLKQNNKNYYYIDSIRKHSAFLGSHILNFDLSINKKKIDSINFYKIKCVLLQLIKGFLNFWAYILNLSSLYKLGDAVFNWQDIIIGVHPRPTSGNISSFYLYNCIDWGKIMDHKKKLAISYNNFFSQLNCQFIRTLDNDTIKIAELNYYPLFVDKSYQTDLLSYLLTKKIFAEKFWEFKEFNQPELNRDLYNSFVILPLSWLIQKKDVFYIYQEITNFVKIKTQCLKQKLPSS